MKNLILKVLIIFVVSACGYSPLMINKNINIEFREIITSGNNEISNKISNRMRYMVNEISENKLMLNSTIKKTIASKNKKGNPEIFNIDLKINLQIFLDDKKFEDKIFNESVSYNNLSSKFELKEREKKIKDSLTDKITNDILLYLQSIQK